jgi:hypothetical protein
MWGRPLCLPRAPRGRPYREGEAEAVVRALAAHLPGLAGETVE